MTAVWILLGIAKGAFIAWVMLRNRAKVAVTIANEKYAMLNQQYEQLKSEKQRADEVVLSLNRELASRSTELVHVNARLTDQRKEIETIQEKFSHEFRNLANDILEEKSKRFTEQNSINIGRILVPLSEKIKDFEKKVEEAYDKESQQRFSLKEEVKRLAELNMQVKMEASNLVRALKGESKTQGNWGEMILESILEKSGLVRDREYKVQQSFTNEHGKRFQPDVLVHFPGERCVVIDSKVSLTAYERFNSANTDDERALSLREHLLSVKKHVDELCAKNYQNLIGNSSLDSVMMFMPIEPAYLLTVQNDPNLWNYAWEKRVVIISPTNLVATLRIVENLWRLENQNRNAEEIARQCGALYDKFALMATDLTELGRAIGKTYDLHQSTMNKLTDGRGNIISKLEGIKKLGAKTSKAMPSALTEKLDTDEEESE